MKCTNCGNELAEDALFCDECGVAVSSGETKTEEQKEEKVFCVNCGAAIEEDAEFCSNCGANQKGGANAAQTAVSKTPAKKKSGVFGIAAAVVVLAVVALVSFAGKGKGSAVDYALYIKDKELFYSIAGSSSATQVTDKLVDDEDVSNSALAGSAGELAYYFVKSDNGKMVFYPDKIDTDDNGFNIYYKKTAKMAEEGTKMDSDVRAYSVDESATRVIYIKEDGDLYSYNLKKQEKEKISGDVEAYRVSTDGKCVYYLNDEGDLYYWTHEKGKDKIDSDVTSVKTNSEDFKTIYYMKEDSFYKKTLGETKEKIASDVKTVYRVYEDGTAYYIKDDSEDQDIADFVYDDKAEEDLNLKKPEWPDAPSRYEFSSNAAYDAAVDAYNKEKEAYEEKWNEYDKKLQRDDMRDRLEENAQFYLEKYKLCYYDGKNEEIVTDSLVGRYSIDYATKKAVMLFSAIDMDSVEKVKLSDFESVYELENEITDALEKNAKHYIAFEDETAEIDCESGKNFVIDANADRVMYYADVDEEKKEGNLYLIKINKKRLSEPELYDSEVYTGSLTLKDEHTCYYKEYEDGEGDLCIDGKQVEYDVAANSGNLRYNSGTDTFYYYTDYDSSKNEGTLKAYSKEKSVKIADDVTKYQVIDGTVYYISDYSSKNYRGELYCYKGKKSVKIDDDVVSVMAGTSSKTLQGGAYKYGW